MTDGTVRPQRNAQVVTQRAGEMMVLLHLARGMYYSLDEVGERVWELCDGSRTAAEVAAVLHEEFDAPIDVIVHDVNDLIEELSSERLLVDA